MSEPQPAKISRNALAAEQARLARFFQTINKHRKALDLAIEENFGCTLDPAEWRVAFESVEPRDANRTMVVTGDHSATRGAPRVDRGCPCLAGSPRRRAWVRIRLGTDPVLVPKPHQIAVNPVTSSVASGTKNPLLRLRFWPFLAAHAPAF